MRRWVCSLEEGSSWGVSGRDRLGQGHEAGGHSAQTGCPAQVGGCPGHTSTDQHHVLGTPKGADGILATTMPGGVHPSQAPTRDTNPPYARTLHHPCPPTTLTFPDHPPESLPPGEAWMLLGPGSPAQVGILQQGLSGPCPASGHPRPGDTAASQLLLLPEPTPAMSHTPISPSPGPPALGAPTGLPGCTAGISVEWPCARGVLTSWGAFWAFWVTRETDSSMQPSWVCLWRGKDGPVSSVATECPPRAWLPGSYRKPIPFRSTAS